MQKTRKHSGAAQAGIHVVAKPAGPACNLNCEYCFYLEKQALFGPGRNFRMTDPILSAFIRGYVESQSTPVVEFVWQGGEPTLLGVDFFRRVIELQKPFRARKRIANSLQTNGTLLTEEWCAFLKKNGFMVGISLDGPREVHDRYRRGRDGRGSFEAVMKGLRLLQKHGIEYNVLASVARETAAAPLEVYRFLRDEGVEFIQFTPIVERRPEAEPGVTPWSVLPEAYGDFLIAVYEEWVRRDVGRIFVMNFEWALNAWVGNPSPVCIHAERCGRSVAVEHNGEVYACDHYVYPGYRLGNVSGGSLPEMVERSVRSGFGTEKETALPARCRACDVLAACRGGCPKHRFAEGGVDPQGLNYLCGGYRKFFLHIRKYLRAMATLLENGLPASLIMDAVKGPRAVTLDRK